MADKIIVEVDDNNYAYSRTEVSCNENRVFKYEINVYKANKVIISIKNSNNA